MQKIKKISSYKNGIWSTPIDIGAKASNVDYIKTVNGAPVKRDLQAELDDMNDEIDTLREGHFIIDDNGTVYPMRKNLVIQNTDVVDNALDDVTDIFVKQEDYFFNTMADFEAASGFTEGAFVYINEG